jgi:membrane fusion protein, multidrug efflux system
MSLRNQATTAILVLVAGLSGWLSGCSHENHSEPAAPETVSNVSVIVAQKTTLPDWLEAVGSVQAAQTTQLSSQMMGNILEIRAREGDRVQSGQVLAVIDDTQLRSGVDQATAALAAAEKEVSAADSDFALAQATLTRYQQLYERKSVSPQEFDEIKARYQSAEARRDMTRARQAQANAALAQARAALDYTRIRAPFAGAVTERKADRGTLTSPGMPIFTIEDTRSYRLETQVDESVIRLVHLGQATPVTIDSLGDIQLVGKVLQIVPAADPASHSFLVKIELPADARLRSGLFGRAHFPRGGRAAILIPQTSVVERGQLQGVYVLDANQVAALRYITLGKSAGETVEVLSGLQDRDKIVAAPGDRELAGKRIAVQQ